MELAIRGLELRGEIRNGALDLSCDELVNQFSRGAAGGGGLIGGIC